MKTYNRTGKLLRTLGVNDQPQGPHAITATHQYTVSVIKVPVTTQDTFWTLSFSTMYILTNKFIRRPYFKISQILNCFIAF